MDQILLSIDIGTSKICVMAVNCTDKKVIDSISAPNFYDIEGLPIGHHEQDPNKIFECVMTLLQELINNNNLQSLVSGICVTGQMHGVMLADNDIVPQSNLITWRDQRFHPQDIEEYFTESVCDFIKSRKEVTGC
ncbi:MAG: FGGY family carbohydrate kinase, partial [Planctomycetota bacterium]